MNPFNTTFRHLRRVAVVMAVVVTSTLLTIAPASAQNTDPVDVTETQVRMNEMALRYGSLSAALAGFYADNQKLSVGNYVTQSMATLANVAGADPATQAAQLSLLGSQLRTITSVSELDAALQSTGGGLNRQSMTSLETAAAELRTKAFTMDAAVASAATLWAGQMVSLRVPALAVPPTPRLDTRQAVGLPAEGLAFGMFTDRSLNALVRQFPNVFAQVTANGVGTADSIRAWNSSISTAMDASRTDLSKVMTTSSTCTGAFLDSMGGSSSSGCSPCSVAGRYANGALQGVLGGTSATNPAINPAEWNALPPAMREELIAQNPSLAQALSTGTTADCSSLSPTVQSTAGSAIDRALDYLGK